ncbi:MAG: AmmeMemoRadiSam system radical SAM enzyme [archaeon]
MQELKEAKFYSKLKDKKLRCNLCYRSCIITLGKSGFCNVRKNLSGKLYSLVYGKPCSINIDPIEKKPIYNYLPGTKTLSLATVGCNFDCKFCQNFSISKVSASNLGRNFALNLGQKIKKDYVSPKEIVNLAIESNCPSISYTYTEPTVFFEYALDIMKLARKNNLKNIWVSNGYMQKRPALKIAKYLDAINIDLKGDKEFYNCLINGADVEVVKENIKLFHKRAAHVEITNLLIEKENTKDEQIRQIASFVASINKNIPLHFSASFGSYKMKSIIPTKIKTLIRAREIANSFGLKYVYLGNI